MKRLIIIIILFALAIPACRKNDKDQSYVYNKTFTGKWIFSEQKIGTGGPGQWQPVQPANQYILFNPDSSVTSTVDFLHNASSYSIVDSIRIKFLPANSPSVSSLMIFKIDSSKGEMILSPLDVLCIEGCSYKFKKEK